MITLGTASAPPGETDTGRLQVGECRDGSATELPIAVINGAEDGKMLYVQAASDSRLHITLSRRSLLTYQGRRAR